MPKMKVHVHKLLDRWIAWVYQLEGTHWREIGKREYMIYPRHSVNFARLMGWQVYD